MEVKTPIDIQEIKTQNGKRKTILSWAIKFVQILLGCILFIWLIGYFSSNNLFDTFQKINLYMFVFSIVCWILVGVLMSERLKYINEHNFGVLIPLKDMFMINQLGMLLSDFTPGRSGYFGIVYYLKKEWRVAYDRSFGTLIGIQLIDFLFKVIFSTIAVFLILRATGIDSNLKSGLIIGLISFTFIIFTCFVLIWYNKATYFERMICKLPYGEKIAEPISKVNRGVSTIKSSWIHMSILSLAGTVVISLQWWLIGNSINISIPIVFYMVIPSLVSTIAFIPIGIAGLGIQEIGVTAILVALGNPVTLAVSFSILLRLSNILGDLTGLIKITNDWIKKLITR